MLELRIIDAGLAMPLFDLPMHMGRQQAAREIGDTIEGLIAFMDDLGGDPDLEDSETGSSLVDETGRYLGSNYIAQDEDREPDDDAKGDISWTEWNSRKRHKVTRHGAEIVGRDRSGNMLSEDHEDDDPDTSVEDDPRGFDPEEDRCPAGDDMAQAGAVVVHSYHGTVWAANERLDQIGCEDDAEPDTDTELNGDEHDYSAGLPYWEH